MNSLTNLLSPLAEGWVMTLFHSIWQGALIAGLVYLVLWTFHVRDPRVRYGVGAAGLAVFILSVTITFFQVMPDHRNISTAADMPADVTFVQMVTQGIAATDTGWSILAFIRENMPFILKIWAAGAILLLFRIMGGYQYMRKIVRRGEDTVPENWKLMIHRIADYMEISRPLHVLNSSHVDMPMVFGHARPVLLLPVTLLTGLSHDQLEAIFAHELAHIRRHDYLVNIGQQVLEAFFFFNPFVWILSKHLRTEREKCCDDLAMEICQNERQYVEALSTLELYRVQFPGSAMMLLGQKGELLARIRRLTDPSYGEAGSSKWVLMIVLSASFFLFSYFTQPDRVAETGEPLIIERQEPLIAGIPGSFIQRRDTVPENEEEVEIEEDVDVDLDVQIDEVIEEVIDLDGNVHVYRYVTPDNSRSFYIRGYGNQGEVIELKGDDFAFVMPDLNFDVQAWDKEALVEWSKDFNNSFSYNFKYDTLPNKFFYNDSLISEEDKEAFRMAQEEMKKAQELMREEQEKMREIMQKYQEEHKEYLKEHPEMMQEHRKAMMELQRELGNAQWRVQELQSPQQRVIVRGYARDQQRLAEEQMRIVERQVAQAQHQLARVHVVPPVQGRVEVRPFFDRGKMENFENQVADMLREDDYLNNDDELKKIEITQDYFKYNGKKVRGGDFEKYLRAYESRFGKLDGKINISLE